MREALLDTDILSEILKRKDVAVLRRADEYSMHHRVSTFSAVSVHEIVFGLIGKDASRQIQKDASRQIQEAREVFRDNAVVLPTFADFERAGVVRGEARRRGRTLPFPDCLIGASAERLGLPVATGNGAHFQPMVEMGLHIDIEDWRAA